MAPTTYQSKVSLLWLELEADPEGQWRGLGAPEKAAGG